ncbi:MAG: hypothetical protein J7M14_08265 [Planctomycetes bacterium]|nr:hypothetical protein [Planctomycetota bacterium]
MKDMTIALVQQHSSVGAKAANLAATIKWARKAAKAGADLICLPELNITGHAGHKSMVAEAEAVPDGPSTRALCELADKLGIYICAGIAEKDQGVHYNTQFIAGPQGYLGKQRKIHLSGDEYFHFRSGTQIAMFRLPPAQVGIVICYDNLVPEVARCLAVRGVELVLAPHAARFGKWPREAAGRRRAVAGAKRNWLKVHCCRAYDNGCYVGICNAVGRAAVGIRGVEANHAGGAMIIDPRGEMLDESRSKDIREEMLVTHLAGAAVAERRSGKCFNLQTRRIEAFGALTEATE